MSLANQSDQGKRRIAVVIPKYGLVGGGERFVSEVTGRLARKGDFEIHVFANQWESNAESITFHKVPNIFFPRFLRPLCFAMFAQWMVDRAGFDVVHAHDRIFRADVFSLHSVPHRGWVRDVRKKLPSLFDRAIITIEHRMIAAGESSWFLPVSSVAKNAFCREYTTLPGQWLIAHPGVDVLRFATPDRAACRAEIRARHEIGLTDLLVLFVGMNFEVKGLDSIIAAVAKARMARPKAHIRLLVVGRGNARKYATIARSFGIADAVAFAGKQVEGIERYYRAADIFMMLSAFDTFGMVVLEAMAAGLPAIVSANVGAKDLVDEGVNGFVLADGGDTDAAAGHIVRLANSDRREGMATAAMRTAAEHSWERLVETISRIYEERCAAKFSHLRQGKGPHVSS